MSCLVMQSTPTEAPGVQVDAKARITDVASLAKALNLDETNNYANASYPPVDGNQDGAFTIKPGEVVTMSSYAEFNVTIDGNTLQATSQVDNGSVLFVIANTGTTDKEVDFNVFGTISTNGPVLVTAAKAGADIAAAHPQALAKLLSTELAADKVDVYANGKTTNFIKLQPTPAPCVGGPAECPPTPTTVPNQG